MPAHAAQGLESHLVELGDFKVGLACKRSEPASAFQSHIRQHWSIENSCHWVLGTAFREDHNQTYIGHAAKNLGALRRIVLNLLKIDLSDTRSLPRKRRRAMLDLTYRDSLPSLA